MATTDWLHAQNHPGATTCFLLGSVKSHDSLNELANYKEVYWFIEQKNLIPQYRIFPNLHPIALEFLNEEKLRNEIQSFLTKDPIAIPDIFCSRSILKENLSAYDFILRKIQIQMEETLRARKTREEEGYMAQKNILENLPYYIQNRLSNCTASALKDIPIAIIGAGPSLNASIHLLEQYHSHFLIFCADSVLSTLEKYKITPDAIISVDAEKPASACLMPNQRTIPLFLSLKSPHDWVERVNAPIHFLSGNILTEDWLSKHGVEKTTTTIHGNCGITAVNLAIHFGGSPILLFGMDHATDESGEGHAEHVNQEISRGTTHNPSKSTSTVPGNYSPKVNTFLLNEWEKLNNLISMAPATQEIWNITDRGAKFEAATLFHPDTFELSSTPLTQRPIIDFRIKQVHPDPLITVKNTIQNLIVQEKSLIDTILKTPESNAPDLLPLLVKLFQHLDLSKLLGNLSFKIIPHLLNWSHLNPMHQENILKETKILLTELAEAASTLSKL